VGLDDLLRAFLGICQRFGVLLRELINTITTSLAPVTMINARKRAPIIAAEYR